MEESREPDVEQVEKRNEKGSTTRCVGGNSLQPSSIKNTECEISLRERTKFSSTSEKAKT